MVESCVVMLLLCLVLFGLLQVSYLVGGRNVIRYTAVATARAATVGMNDFMLHKVSHYTGIATAGPVKTPQNLTAARPAGASLGAVWRGALSRTNRPASVLGEYEIGVREAYMLADTASYDSILDYENWWGETDIRYSVVPDPKEDLLYVSVEQNLPMVFPFSHVFFGHHDSVDVARGDRIQAYPAKLIRAEVTIEDHAAYYLKSE